MSEVGTRPSVYPEWASGGSADISEPSSTKKQTGWIHEIPPHEWFNWLDNLNYLWAKYLDEGRPRTFTTLESAIAALAVDEIALVKEWDGTKAPGEVEGFNTTTSAFAGTRVVASDGVNVYLGEDDKVYAYDRSDGSESWSKTVTSSPVTAIHADGEFVWVAFGANGVIWKLDPADGSTEDSGGMGSGQAVYGLYSNGSDKLIAVGEATGSIENVRDFDRDDLTTVNTSLTIASGQDVNAIDGNGQYVFCATTYDSTDTANLYRIEIDGTSSVYGYANAGGSTDDMYAVTVLEDIVIVGGDRNASDGVAFYGHSTISLAEIWEGQTHGSDASAGIVSHLANDGHYAYLAGGAGSGVTYLPSSRIRAIDPKTGHYVWSSYAAPTTAGGICCDACAVWASHQLASGSTLSRVWGIRQDRYLRRTDQTDTYKPGVAFALAIPLERH